MIRMDKNNDNNLLESIRLRDISNYSEENGYLIFIEGKNDIYFSIERVFVVYASLGQIRGQHAHKECSQFLVCLHGEVVVKCNDGKSSSMFSLKNPTQGILIPPGIWAEQVYKEENSILMVLCDREYNEGDYIRDFNEFLLFTKNLLNVQDENRNG
jgi:dTDP-4-dehydrorhamnose 3,5-epimerase-like enzyme